MSAAQRGKCSDEIERLIVDPNAETTHEICAACGRSRWWVNSLAAARIASGEWERVWKNADGHLVPAYRKVKDKRGKFISGGKVF